MGSKKRKTKVIKSPPGEMEKSWVYPDRTYIQTSKGVFPISELEKHQIEVKKKEDKAKTTQLKAEARYLSDNDLIPLPFEPTPLFTLKDNCSFFDACVKRIGKDVIGQGWEIPLKKDKKDSKDEKKRINLFLKNDVGDDVETIEDVMEKLIVDWGITGWFGIEVSRDSKGLVNGIWHVPAYQIRVHKSKDKYCQIVDTEKVWFKRFGLEKDINRETGDPLSEEEIEGLKEDSENKKVKKANEMIFYKNYYPQSMYYGAPNILSSTGALFGLIGIRDYNLAFFENYGIPAALIVLEGKWRKDDAKHLTDFIDVEIKGSEQAHKTVVAHPGRDCTLTYHKLGVEVKEGSFQIYYKGLRDEVLVAYNMPPYRIGIIEVGSLGGSTAVESTKIYDSSVVKPLEKVLNRIMTIFVFERGLKIENYEFRLKEMDLRDLDAEAKRDQLYFGMGTLTPNEILKRQGKETYPEGDQHYIQTMFIAVGEESVEKRERALFAEFEQLKANIIEILEKRRDDNEPT